MHIHVHALVLPFFMALRVVVAIECVCVLPYLNSQPSSDAEIGQLVVRAHLPHRQKLVSPKRKCRMRARTVDIYQNCLELPPVVVYQV